MANENNNTNELVSTEDEVTAELQQLTLQQVLVQSVPEPELEDDADTFEFERMPGRERRERIELLNADLESRRQSIERLQFDLEELRSRFNGMQTEVRAREEITNDLKREIANANEQLTTRGRQLQKRDRTIRELKAEIRDRESNFHERLGELRDAEVQRDRLSEELAGIQAELEELTSARNAAPAPVDDAANASLAAAEAANAELRVQLERTEGYADGVRKQLADRSELAEALKKDLAHVRLELAESNTVRDQQEAQIRTQSGDNRALGEQIAVMQARHNEEVQSLRQELSSALDSIAGIEATNEKLATELAEAQGYRDEIERMFERSDERQQQRILELEAELASVREQNESNKAKLGTKTDALNALLAEFRSMTPADEPPLDEPEQRDITEAPRDRDRINRMLIGRIDNQELRFPLFKQRLTIGRTPQNDIQLNVPYISRRHAVLLTDGDAARVVDWGSKNGVYVNSRRITEHFLKSGDRVTIGNAEFRYEERPRREP